jgi:NAD(P)-dependent dehydrogenase (short-subunit alcohol dehydrogenase family)
MILPSLSLEGKVAIVTGAAGIRGMGRAIALTFAQAGADVAVCDIIVKDDIHNLEETAQEIRKLGQRSIAVPTDITNKDNVETLVSKTMDELGDVDILVNNAGGGIGRATSLIEIDEEVWHKVLDINLTGCYLLCHMVGKRMMERKTGSIINTSSVMGIRQGTRGQPTGVGRGSSTYAIAKAGVVMLTRGLARELAPYHIRVNAIAPGGIRTDMIRQSWETPEALERLVSTYPLGRIGEPQDIATAALFLASDASSFITGHILVVDGGLLA